PGPDLLEVFLCWQREAELFVGSDKFDIPLPDRVLKVSFRKLPGLTEFLELLFPLLNDRSAGLSSPYRIARVQRLPSFTARLAAGSEPLLQILRDRHPNVKIAASLTPHDIAWKGCHWGIAA